ncbi:MAG: roadblock/LC7 domain-containing protein [Anaerolineae bacterium]|jgi:predicted regulator of Ras-like GTPase activity (Roadblock/LC7/MglB family)
MPPVEFREQKLIAELKKLYYVVEGVKAVVIVNIDGLLVSSYPVDDEENPHETPTSSPQVAAMSATLVGLAEKTLVRLAQGKLERLLMEAEEGTMVVYPAGRTAVAVLVEKNANMAHVLFATKQAAAEIAVILAG